MRKSNLPDFSFEKVAWERGFNMVAGMDEVGRGCFAGPVIAAAVAFAPINNYQFTIFNKLQNKIIINDSKKLTSQKRELAAFWIKRNAVCYGIGKASVGQINKFGIKKASEMAFRRAIKNCNKRIDYLLIDVTECFFSS